MNGIVSFLFLSQKLRSEVAFGFSFSTLAPGMSQCTTASIFLISNYSNLS